MARTMRRASHSHRLERGNERRAESSSLMKTSPNPFGDDLAMQRRILAGDRCAAEALFRRHVDAVYSFVHYRVAGDVRETEDVVSETFLEALEVLATYEGRASLHQWLCGIARNKIRMRRRQRRTVPLHDVLLELDPEIDAILAQVQREPLPDWVLEREETRDLVGATLASLPPEYQAALLEKYVNEGTLRDVARRLERSEKAAESLLHRARLAFARIFELLANGRGGTR